MWADNTAGDFFSSANNEEEERYVRGMRQYKWGLPDPGDANFENFDNMELEVDDKSSFHEDSVLEDMELEDMSVHSPTPDPLSSEVSKPEVNVPEVTVPYVFLGSSESKSQEEGSWKGGCSYWEKNFPTKYTKSRRSKLMTGPGTLKLMKGHLRQYGTNRKLFFVSVRGY